MAVQIQGNNGTIAEVDGTTFRALRVTARPIDYGALGHYQMAVTSVTLSAVQAANAALFCFRWDPTDGTKLAVVSYIQLSFQALALFTANTLTDFGFDAYVGRGWATAPTTNGTAIVTSGNNCKTRTSMGTSSLTAGDVKISSGAAAGITSGSPTQDVNPFASSIGDSQRVNPAAGTEEQRVNDPTLIWSPNAANGEHPLVFADQEGFLLKNRTVWPAAGTGIIQVHVRWAEVTAY